MTAQKKPVALDLDDEQLGYLRALGKSDALGKNATVADVIQHLIDAAVDGVRRPGAWERQWLYQAFGDEWCNYLEPDPKVEFYDSPTEHPSIDALVVAPSKAPPTMEERAAALGVDFRDGRTTVLRRSLALAPFA